MKHWTLSKSQLMFPKLGYLQTSLSLSVPDLAQIQARYTFGVGDNRWRGCKKVGRLFIHPGHGTF